MRRQILAVCDTDEAYVTAFAKRIARQRTAGLEVHGFTGTKALLESSDSPDLLLISQELMDDPVKKRFAGRILVLAEERSYGQKAGPDDSCCRGSIYKYQALSEMMRQVLDAFSKDGSASAGNPDRHEEGSGGYGYSFQKPEAEFIGVYSPVGRCGKTSFALTLALHLQKRKPALFLSFALFSGWKALFPQAKDASGSLADGIYYLRSGNLKVAEKLLAAEQKIGELAFLPPFPDPQDLLYVTDEEWRIVLDSIRNETGFEAVVADLGVVPAFCPAILLNFSKIYVPAPNDAAGQRKWNAFEAYLRENRLDLEMKERMEPVTLRTQPEWKQNGFCPEQLLYGPNGTLAEELIQREGL